jgi:hypothetical protein
MERGERLIDGEPVEYLGRNLEGQLGRAESEASEVIERAYRREGTVYVPESKPVKFIFGILLIVAGVILLVGISSLSTIFSLIQSSITSLLSSLIGWDPMISTILVGVIALFFATLIYVLAKRGSSVIQRIERTLKLNVTNEPTEYYALDIVPEEEILHELRKRGCSVETGGEGSEGVSVSCPEMPVSKRLEEAASPGSFTLAKIQKVAVAAVMAVIWAVYIGSAIYGAVEGDGLWIAAMALLALTSLVLMGTKVAKLWHTVVMWLAVNIAFTFFLSTSETVVWSLWGVLSIYTVLVAVFYLLHGRKCVDSWYCEVV